MGSLNDSFLVIGSGVLLLSVNGKTCKPAIKRPIKNPNALSWAEAGS